jgi:hypothetical protein
MGNFVLQMRTEAILVGMDGKKDDKPPGDPRLDWDSPESDTSDHCNSAPDIGLYNDDIRLWRLGLDPDKQTSLDILIELKRRMAEIKKEEAEQERKG